MFPMMGAPRPQMPKRPSQKPVLPGAPMPPQRAGIQLPPMIARVPKLNATGPAKPKAKSAAKAKPKAKVKKPSAPKPAMPAMPKAPTAKMPPMPF